MEVEWNVNKEVAAACNADLRATTRTINLLDQGNTLPFIARYRKEATGNMEPEMLRQIKSKLASYR